MDYKFIVIIIVAIINVFVLKSFDFQLNLITYFYKNFPFIGYPHTIEDIPYIKKFRLLSALEKDGLLTERFYNFIASSSVPKLISNLKQKDIWTAHFFSELRSFMDSYVDIKNEIQSFYNKSKQSFNPIGKHYNSQSNNIFKPSEWTTYNIIKNNQQDPPASDNLPILCHLLNNLPSFMGWAFISVLHPNTNIPLHRGEHNFKLTCHIGISGFEQSYFKINEQKLYWKEKEYFVFDDSQVHEVIHKGSEDRIVLVIDLFHPDLNYNEKRSINKLLFLTSK